MADVVSAVGNHCHLVDAMNRRSNQIMTVQTIVMSIVISDSFTRVGNHNVLEHQFALPENFDGTVRLFPLPNLVLFPGNIQPLHIFEDRYREMFEDAIAGDQLITMATLAPGKTYGYPSRPKVADVVCIGRILHHQQREDGTYDLVLFGLRRAIIRNELPPVRSYREANVQVLADAPETPVEQGEIGRQLLQRFRRIAPEAKKILDAFESGELEMSHFADIMAFSYPFDLDVELLLLAEPSARKRAQIMLKHLPSESPGHDPPPFSMN